MIPIMATRPKDWAMGIVETNIAAEAQGCCKHGVHNGRPGLCDGCKHGIVKRTFPGLLVEPGMELDRIIDPKTDHDRKCSHYRESQRDTGQTPSDP